MAEADDAMAEADEGTVAWRALLAEAESRLAAAEVADARISARRIVEEASGFEGPRLDVEGLDALATVRGVARFDDMIARRLTGEPLQYVVGRWGFRSLDLLVDRRVLIPRPETEEVAGWALEEVDRCGAEATVVDLGTGSGAIGLAILAERSRAEVWMSDRSPSAVEVARANLAGLGRAGSRGRIVEGSWFEALPVELTGTVSVVVSNPPYVAPDDDLPPEVENWEPTEALVAPDDGLADLRQLVNEAPRWLLPQGALVLEMAPKQTPIVAAEAAEVFDDVEIKSDMSGRDRSVVARFPRRSGASSLPRGGSSHRSRDVRSQ